MYICSEDTKLNMQAGRQIDVLILLRSIVYDFLKK
jgi:hypothetical protein